MMEADLQRRFSSNDSGSGTTEHDGSWQHTCTKFATEEQQKLVETAVENQAEDEVENHVDEANKVRKVKKCHMRNKQQHQAEIESQRPCETTGSAAHTSQQSPGLRKAESP